MKGSDIVIQFLETIGITHVFTVSGGGCIHLIDSLGKSTKLKYICTHHEQAAAIAAEGFARMKEGIGACIVTTGPGGTNALTGVLGCWLDSIPCIFISGQVPTSQTLDGTGCRQIGDQEHNIVDVVKHMTKYAVKITDKNKLSYELDKAYSIAVQGRPGPVWIDIPLDIQGANIDTSWHCEGKMISYIQHSCSEKDIKEFKKLLFESKRPLVIAGNGIRLSHSYSLFNEWLKQINIPALTGVHSGVDCIDNTYSQYAGRIGILGNLSSNKIVMEADLLIIIGSRLTYKMTGYNVEGFAPGAKKIIIDIDENEMNKHSFHVDLKIKSDIHSFLYKIMNESLELDHYILGDWFKYIHIQRHAQTYCMPKHINMKDYLSLYFFMCKLNDYLNLQPIITTNGSAHVVTLQTLQLKKNQRMFTNVGCASMGYGLPAAIGASFALNNKQDVVCIEGDGSLQMNIQELQTMKHHKLPIKLFVVNNNGYLSIKITQEAFLKGHEVASGPLSGVSFPSLKKIAKAYGIPYFSIKSNKQIPKLSDILKYKGPIICELFTHPFEQHEPKVISKGIDSEGQIIPGNLTNMYSTETL